MSKRHTMRGALPRRTALALALGLGFAGLAYGQATTGAIFGSAPAGETVVVSSANGVQRSVTVGADGRYTVGHLPLGTYTVTLQDNGQVVSTRNNVTLQVGGGTEVAFAGAGATAANAETLGAIQVTANALPAIDVSSVSSSTVITSAQLEQLPVSHNAESIALLAPGTVQGSGYYGNAVSFGGAGVSENAYYVNGFNTTDIYSYTGSTYQLPYGAIAQQQTFTGGYDAKYGRSDGGVINQVGKRGSNQWHFGGRVSWAPRYLQASPKNTYFPIQDVPEGWIVENPEDQGKLRRYRNANKQWQTQYAAYLGGPLIENTLYFYLAAERTESHDRNVGDIYNRTDTYGEDRENNFYAKVDWNINDNNILEVTKLHDTVRNNAGVQYRFDNDTRQDTVLLGENEVTKNTTDAYILHYTGYLTDAATLSVLYGNMTRDNPRLYPFQSPNPGISSSSSQNPAYWTDGSPIINDQTRFYTYLPDATSHSQSLRADFSYRLGDHLLEVGIDNVKYNATDQGQTMSGPGYAWIYSETAEPGVPIKEGLGVGAPGERYYVARYIYSVAASMSAKQKAWYIQDTWNVTDNVLLKLGLRNDHFINYNDQGETFVDEDNQWEPRIGVSWDVYGDSSLKIYGNVGRYYLALPQSVAQRAATPSTFTYEYFTYTGINANGEPTGLTPVGGLNGAPAPGPVSSNFETGQPKDPNVVTAKNLKAQYQDEYIVGFDKTLGPNWVYGAKATYRDLGTSIDDICDVGRIATKMTSMGLDPDNYAWNNPGCRIFNPGENGTFVVNALDGSDPVTVSMSPQDWGFERGATRKYYGLDLYLAHPFDGKWFARIDYTFSRNWGNTEGQVRSDIGQTDVSKTEDWDFASLMEGSYGYLANHRRHQLKIRGAYQFTPEWLVSGTLRVQSGTPNACLGYYGTDALGDPSNYGPDYRWCNGSLSPRGENGFTPWTKQLNLGVRYTPDFADQKLAFSLDVFNALNGQETVQIEPHHDADKHVVNSIYGAGVYFQQPRYVRLSVSYDY